REQRPVRGRVRPRPRGDHGGVPARGASPPRVRGALSMESRRTRLAIRLGADLTLLFLYVPLGIVFLYAFNPSRGQSWPLPGLTTHWFSVAWHNGDVRGALLTSVIAGLGATTIALLLGSAAAFAVHRYRFF